MAVEISRRANQGGSWRFRGDDAAEKKQGRRRRSLFQSRHGEGMREKGEGSRVESRSRRKENKSHILYVLQSAE